MSFKNLDNSSQLIEFFENWISFNGEGYDYDSVGMMYIFRACLRNIEKRFIEGDYEEMKEVFESSDLERLKKVVDLLSDKSSS